jgi:hypothetical protein
LGKLAFEIADFILDGLEVDFRLGLERIHIARDVQVEVVGYDFLKTCLVGIPLPVLTGAVRLDNLGDIFIA